MPNIPQQTYPVGATLIPQTFTKPAGATLVSAQLKTPTDWVTGAAGRTLDVSVEKSFDAGGTWRPSGGGSDVSPHLAKDGSSLPTIVQVDVGADPSNAQYRVTVTVGGGSISTAWVVTVA